MSQAHAFSHQEEQYHNLQEEAELLEEGEDLDMIHENRNIPWKKHNQEGSLYALAWQAFRKTNWDDNKKYYNGQLIQFSKSDQCQLILLIAFLATCTYALIMFVCLDRLDVEYSYQPLHLVLVRATAQYFMHRVVVSEYNQGSIEMRYAMWRPHEFSHPIAAAHMGLIQALQASLVNFSSIVMILSMEDLTTLITRFTCLTILTQLDNFQAEVILQEQIILDDDFEEKAEFKEYKIEIKDTKYGWKKNKTPLTVYDKLSLLKPDLECYNMQFSHKYWKFMKSVPLSPLLELVDIQDFPWKYSWFIVLFLSYFLPFMSSDWDFELLKEALTSWD